MRFLLRGPNHVYILLLYQHISTDASESVQLDNRQTLSIPHAEAVQLGVQFALLSLQTRFAASACPPRSLTRQDFASQYARAVHTITRSQTRASPVRLTALGARNTQDPAPSASRTIFSLTLRASFASESATPWNTELPLMFAVRADLSATDA